MEGSSVNTYKLVNAEGVAHLAKFSWVPKLGVKNLTAKQAAEIQANDVGHATKDLYDAIERGDHPEWELGLQLIEEERADKLGIDLLDATKLLPEEQVPVLVVGRLVLNRNPENHFAEVEQVAFHPGHVVPGIDFSNDPLLQGRLFSYGDAQLARLGGPNCA
jgi:catalase